MATRRKYCQADTWTERQTHMSMPKRRAEVFTDGGVVAPLRPSTSLAYTELVLISKISLARCPRRSMHSVVVMCSFVFWWCLGWVMFRSFRLIQIECKSSLLKSIFFWKISNALLKKKLIFFTLMRCYVQNCQNVFHYSIKLFTEH